MRVYRGSAGAVLLSVVVLAPVMGQIPDHPVVTEVYTDPNGGSDAAVGRDPANPHQEYLELYLPPAASLRPSLNKDALRLAFYEVEGDITSSGYTLVNYRIDLPTFDLDPSNGLTAGAVARPSSGVVVIGWVDYVGDPPTGLAGSPSTRVALVNGGVTSTSGYTFIALNGAQFTGTTNFPVPSAISLVNMPLEAGSGIVQNGSGAYLLVNRDAAGYVQLFDDEDPDHVPPTTNADPALATGTVLLTSALLDGFAANDDSVFDVLQQPYPFGGGIDLDEVLPFGGPFSRLLAQVPEFATDPVLAVTANGFARRFVDVAKTTESGTSGDDDPVLDAVGAYRAIYNDGPFRATPGQAVLSNTAPELSAASGANATFQVLAATTTEVGLLAANVGGNYPINISLAAGGSSNPATATFAAGAAAMNVAGQEFGFPGLRITGGAAAANGASATTTATLTASNSVGGQPAVVNPVRMTTVTATVLNPTRGLDAAGQPFQATVFLAVQPVAAGAAANEFRTTSLGTHAVAHLGDTVLDTRGLGGTLVSAATNLNDGPLMQSLVRDFPDPGLFLSWPGPPGRLNLYQTVVQSAEAASGATTYDDAIDAGSQTIRAVRLNIPDTRTYGGSFTPTEPLFFADATGLVGDPPSPLSNATTARTFELAIFETNTRDDSTLESGATDDFGLILEVAEVEPGSTILPGELVFLSFTGGLQGADIDTLEGASNVGTIVYLDLDNLHEVLGLGISVLEAIFVVDGSGTGEVDVIEVFSLNPAGGFLASSIPAAGQSLPRSNRNTVRLTFASNIGGPVGGQILIQQMLAGGTFGSDLSAGFSFTVENDGQGNPRILKIIDVDPPNLVHRQWYSIRSTGGWTGGGVFEAQFVVQIGDANGDNGVFNLDAGAINAGIPNLGAPDQDRRDIDGDATILNDDVSIANVRIPSFPVAKPSGH